MQVRAPAGPSPYAGGLGVGDADPVSKDVEVGGLQGVSGQPGAPAPTAPTSEAEGTEEVSGPKTRDPKLAQEARERHLADPQANHLQHQLQGQWAEGAQGVEDARGPKGAQRGRSHKPDDQKDMADKYRSQIDELRGEARALRAGAIEVLNGAPTGEDAMDSRSFTAKAAASDAEADGLEPKLREEEMKRRVVTLEPLTPGRTAPAAASPA